MPATDSVLYKCHSRSNPNSINEAFTEKDAGARKGAPAKTKKPNNNKLLKSTHARVTRSFYCGFCDRAPPGLHCWNKPGVCSEGPTLSEDALRGFQPRRIGFGAYPRPAQSSGSLQFVAWQKTTSRTN